MLTQEQINQVLLEEAQKGQRVVRLKGGDPFLFGRGGEELELLTVNGIPYEIVPGELHTVNPVANDVYPIYKENTREYALLKTVNFGTVLMMEVGALMVGRIENVPLRGRVKRGKEKGNFAFGGSTVILMTQKERVLPDPDIFMNSEKGIETRVKLGERIGVSEILE